MIIEETIIGSKKPPKFKRIKKTFVHGLMIELKLTKKELPTGQRISYERLVKDTTIAGKKSVVFVVEHEVFDCKKPIIVKDCFVREMYFTDDLEWKKFRNKVNIRDLVKRYVSYLDKIEKVAKC